MEVTRTPAYYDMAKLIVISVIVQAQPKIVCFEEMIRSKPVSDDTILYSRASQLTSAGLSMTAQ